LSEQRDISDITQAKRAQIIRILGILYCVGVTILCVLLAAVVLWRTDSIYPNARLVADDGIRFISECPTFGARIGSVRSPLCSWGITRKRLFETDDTVNQVSQWYATREQTWEIGISRLSIRLWLAHMQPTSGANRRERFFVETNVLINVSQ
jgi:hypothetical protein